MKSLMRSICFAAGERAIPLKKSLRRGSLSSRGMIDVIRVNHRCVHLRGEELLTTEGVGAEGKGAAAE